MKVINADKFRKILIKNGWLKQDFLKDSAEMIAVDSLIDELQFDDLGSAKPVLINQYGNDKCPSCGSLNVTIKEECCGGTHKFIYCPDCGQKLDRG